MNPLLDPNSRLVIAHRGDRAHLPENTIDALRHAVELGSDALEFDVRVTRDGVAVLLHDPTLDRTTDAQGSLASILFRDLQTVDASKATRGRAGHRLAIPSLEEVLDRFRETPLVMEVKELPAVDPTAELIRRFSARDRVVVGSADARVVERFAEMRMSTCASTRQATRLIPLALGGLRPAKPAYELLSIPTRFRGLPIPVLRMAAAARKVGIATQVWTINDARVAKRLWQGGVAGVVTDDPGAMIRARAS